MAFRVIAAGEACDGYLVTPRGGRATALNHVVRTPFTAVVPPGDEVEVHAVVTEDSVAHAKLVLAWTVTPARLGKRRRQA